MLIIDDDASVCELMRRNLGEEGIPSLAAHSGEEGLRLAKQLLPSAIILDILMPGIDGWAVLAALKTDSEMTEIPIIMASMLDEKERGLRMGADEFVSKPFGPDRLAELLRKHLRGHDSGRSSASRAGRRRAARLARALAGPGLGGPRGDRLALGPADPPRRLARPLPDRPDGARRRRDEPAGARSAATRPGRRSRSS